MPIDKYEMIKVLEGFPKQCREALDFPKGLTVSGEIRNIVVAGMGGSAIGGDILKSYMSSSKIPVFVNRTYNLPGFVNSHSLVFIVSYSGNTEETLSAFKDAVQKNAKVVCITSGGDLADLSKKAIKIPAGFQPREALGYLFFPMLGVLYNSGLIQISNKELNEALSMLSNISKFKEEADLIARKIRNKIPIIYSSNILSPIAYRLKCQLNENSKQPAFCHSFPEMNHNELAGYKLMDRKFIAVIIKDDNDHERIKKRMEICSELMEKTVDTIEVFTKGEHLLTRLFYGIYLGDWISYYAAMHNRIDPTPVEIIEEMKRRLSK